MPIMREPSASRKRRLSLATAYLVLPRCADAFFSAPSEKNSHHAHVASGIGTYIDSTTASSSSLQMVASKPRLDEGIIIGGDASAASVKKNGVANNGKFRAKKKNNKKKRKYSPQKSGKRRGNLPLLDMENSAYPIHEEMSESMRQMDAFRRKNSAVMVQQGMHILDQAVHVLDKYLAADNDNEDCKDDQLNEWIAYYTTKVLRAYLHLERQQSANQRRQSNNHDPLASADSLLQRVEERFASPVASLPWMNTAAALVPSSYLREKVYNHLIGAYTKRAKLLGGGESSNQYIAAAESILERMSSAGAEAGLVAPDAKTYGLILSAYARCGDAVSAASLLTRMEQRYDTDNGNCQCSSPSKPGVICYNAVLNAHSRAGRPNDAMQLLRRMAERNVKADVVSYTSILDGWARWLESSDANVLSAAANDNDDDAAVMEAISHAEDIMSMLEKSDNGPNVVAYNALLKVYLNGAKRLGGSHKAANMAVDDMDVAKCIPLLLAKRASAVFGRMSKSKVYPDRITYSSAIHVCAAAADSIALKHEEQGWQGQAMAAATLAQDILMTMERSFVHNGDARLAPPIKLYNMVITALGRCQLEAGISEARALIHHLEEHDHLGIDSLPNTVTYTAYMKALADMCCPSAARRAEEVLVKMERSYRDGNSAVKPSLISYNTSLRAWAKIHNRIGAQCADRVLSQMEAKRNAGISNICPDLYSYSICIDAWAKSRDRSAGERAEDIFRRMQSEPACLSPNLVVYNGLIHAWSVSQDPRAGEKTMDILDEMERRPDVNPDRFTYSSVIDALAKSGMGGSALRSEDVLARMEGLGTTPSIVTYNCMLNVLASSGDEESAPRAEALLDRMEHSDIISWNTAIKAWAQSSREDKASKAQGFLQTMLENESAPSPDLVTFNTVLNVCASSHGVGAFQIAMDTFSTLQQSQHLRPNEYTYGTLIKAYATLLPPGQERTNLIEQIFQHCCENNCLSEPVLRMLNSSVSDDDYAHIVAGAKELPN